MNHGAMVAIHAATIAAAAAAARTKALDAFRVHDATRPERARTLAEIGLSGDDHAVGELIAAGVLRGVDTRGRLTVLGDSVDRVAGYYLDEPAYIAYRDGKGGRTSRKEAVLMVCILVLAAIGVAALAVVVASRR
jgi:hypothetical protein